MFVTLDDRSGRIEVSVSGDTLSAAVTSWRKILCWWSVVRYLTMNIPVACG